MMLGWAQCSHIEGGRERERGKGRRFIERIVAPYPSFTTGYTLMLDWGGANGFDVVTSSTPNMHSPYAFYIFRLRRTLGR